VRLGNKDYAAELSRPEWNEMERHLRPGELAHLTGISTSTLRRYERLGLITRTTRAEGRCRSYPGDSLQRVQLARRALGMGFTLPELVRILRAVDSRRPPCKQVHALAIAKLGQLDQFLDELLRLHEHLQELLAAFDKGARHNLR